MSFERCMNIGSETERVSRCYLFLYGWTALRTVSQREANPFSVPKVCNRRLRRKILGYTERSGKEETPHTVRLFGK